MSEEHVYGGSIGNGDESKEEPSYSKEDLQIDTNYEKTILEILDFDCVMTIFSYLRVQKLVQTETVSKRWRELVKESLRGVRVLNISQRSKPSYTKRMKKMETVSIAYNLNRRIFRAVSELCPNLTQIRLMHLYSEDWRPLFTYCTQLKSVTFYKCHKIFDNHFQNMKCKLEEFTLVDAFHIHGAFLEYLDKDSLKKLILVNCCDIYHDSFVVHLGAFKNLIKLGLHDSMYLRCDKLVKSVPNLIEFSFCDHVYDYLNPVRVEAIQHLKELKVLLLSNNEFVNDNLLKLISTSCPKLTTLDINMKNSAHSGITDVGINYLWKLQALEALSIGGLEISDMAFNDVGVYGGRSNLRSLLCQKNVFRATNGLLKVVKMCTNIRQIDISGSKRVEGEFFKSVSRVIMMHPNRTEKLILYIGSGIHKYRKILNSLNCPLIHVVHDSVTPLECCEYLDADSDDSDSEFALYINRFFRQRLTTI